MNNVLTNIENHKISVIIPVFNAEKYIKRCLNSVINQKYKNLEIIVINDGSTDTSLDIINKFASKDKRIIVYNQKNQGGNVALNNGIKYATGNYIHFLDADDYLTENVYQYLIDKTISNNVDLCLFNYVAIDNENKVLYKNNIQTIKNEFVTTLNDSPDILIYYYSAQWMMFLKSSIIKDNNLVFDNTKFGYDMLMHLNAIRNSKRILVLKDCLVNYRIGNADSSSGNNTRSKDYSIHFECFKNCVNAYKNENKIIRDINICRQYDICMVYLDSSISEYKIRNYFLLKNFSESFTKNVVNSLKQKKEVYDKYLSIIDYSYINNYFNKIINNLKKERKIILNSKSYKLGRILTKPFRILISITNKLFKLN